MNKAYNIVKPIMIVIIICLALIAILSIYNMGYKQLMGSDYAFLLDYSSHEVNEDNMTPDLEDYFIHSNQYTDDGDYYLTPPTFQDYYRKKKHPIRVVGTRW